jgi:hypothetical protein
VYRSPVNPEHSTVWPTLLDRGGSPNQLRYVYCHLPVMTDGRKMKRTQVSGSSGGDSSGNVYYVAHGYLLRHLACAKRGAFRDPLFQASQPQAAR